ncbi:MAG TPA: TlpA disulfide reductase family protein [Pirellulales bacterium]|nr:TlpA disulfide reductase family protein [Pirellulales bacterium]
MPDEMQSEPNSPPPARSAWGTWGVVAVGAVLVVLWLSYLRPHIQFQQAINQPGVSQPLPALELQPLTGATEGVSLEALRGKVTLINYWGPWCGYCVEEFPHLVELWDKNRGNPEFAFISVSSGGHAQENVLELKDETEKFLKSREATFPTYVDPDGANRQVLASVADMRGFVYPTTVLLDRRGVIRALWFGYEPGYSEQMEQLVSQLLTEGSNAKP